MTTLSSVLGSVLSAAALSLFVTVAACGPGASPAVDAAPAHVDAPSMTTHIDAAASSIDAMVSHSIDAAVQHGTDAAEGGSNPLGIVCEVANPTCPGTGSLCTKFSAGDSQGICSPMCTSADPSPCTNGYTGLAGGQPVCALASSATMMVDACAIICTAPDQCPTGTVCTVASGTTSICEPSA